MSAVEVADALQLIERKIEAAAAQLVPVLTGTTADPVDIARAVHDALNHLASARLRAGLALETLDPAVAQLAGLVRR